MNTITADLENKIMQLLASLDGDIENLRTSLARLDALRGFVIKRDDKALTSLLEEIKQDSQDYSAVENQRDSIRMALANAFGSSYEEMNLTNLAEKVSGRLKEDVLLKKNELAMLIEKLRTEHSSTAFLLSECAGFNRRLLKGILRSPDEGMTYSQDGRKKWHRQTNVMNLRL